MDKNILYPLLSLLLVILVAGGIYYIADMFGGTEIHHEGGHEEEGHGEETEEGHPAAPEEVEALFFAAMEKPLGYEEYTYEFEERASNGYSVRILLVQGSNYTHIKKEDAIFTRELYLADNTTILCLENVNRKVCSDIAQNSTFNPYTITLQSLLFDHDRIEQGKANNELFIEYGAIEFAHTLDEKEYGGKNCTELAYTLDYSKLTLEQLRVVGMDPKSPEILLSKEYKFTLCIDPETNDVVHKSLGYMNFGVPESTESFTLQAVWGEAQEVEFPGEVGGEMEMDDFYYFLKRSQENYAKCLIDEDFDNCIRSEAISSRNERLCELIDDAVKKDGCYLSVALEKGTPSLCNMLSPELFEDCYMEFAWKYKDVAYCGQIQNETKKAECMGLVTEPGQAQEEAPEEVPPEEEEGNEAAECTVDADCTTAGCSSQLCLPLELSDVVTTCEYVPEYDCLPMSTCGCYEGKCGWEQNQEYLNCLDEKTTQ